MNWRNYSRAELEREYTPASPVENIRIYNATNKIEISGRNHFDILHDLSTTDVIDLPSA